MQATEREELRRLEERATPGPWGVKQLASGLRHLERNCSDWYFEGLADDHNLPGRQDGDGGLRDAEFIVAARSTMRALLADLDASEEANAGLEKALDELVDCGVEDIDPRMSYVVMQIDRPSWKQAQEVLAAAKAAPHALRDAIRDAVVLISDLLSETDPDEDGTPNVSKDLLRRCMEWQRNNVSK